MHNIYSLLAMPAWLTENAKWIAVGAAALIVIIAFCVGFSKGFTRLSWGALIWTGACALFFVLEKKFHASNPVLKMGLMNKFDPLVRDFASTLSIALVSVLAAVAVFGLLALLARPKRKRRKTVVRYYEDDGDEDIDDEDYDEDEMPRRMKNGAIVEKKPCTFNRVLGGIVCIFNAALAIAAAACILLVIFEVTPLKTGALKNVFDSAAVAKTWKYIHTYTLDFVMIGIVAAMGYGGYKTGVLRGFRSVFLTVGYIAAIGVAFWLPFSKFAVEKEWLSFVGKLSGYFERLILKGLPEAVAPVLGKVACGLVLCVGFCIAVAIVGLLLKLIQKAVAQVAVLRFIDGVLSTLLLMALGAVICALLMAVLYTLQHYGIFEGSRLFETNSSLSQGFYAAFDQYLKPVFEKISQKING